MAICLQFNLHHRLYMFKPRLGFTFLCLFFVGLFIVLGNWQLHRFHYKKNLLNSFSQALLAKPAVFQTLKQPLAQFQHVQVSGHYVETIFLSNKPHENLIGFEVLSSLQIPNENKRLLIDRGWVPRTSDVTTEHAPNNELVTGYVKWLNEHQFILGDNLLQQNPLTLQRIDIAELKKITGFDYFDYVVRLDASSANGFVRDWKITAVEPERHMGYAIQWFVMAIVLFLAFLGFSTERQNTDNNDKDNHHAA
jgi:surfeit locus 1 family protein